MQYKKVKQGYIVFDDNGNHTHIRSAKTCRLFLSLMKNRIMPESEFLKESARRMLKVEEYEKLVVRKIKDCYYNVNGKKGVK